MGRSRKIRRILSLAGGNLLSFALILALVALVGEVWLRLQWPFLLLHGRMPQRRMLLPDTEYSWTNHRDFWTVSRTNSWGFLDREPISPERAAASCHVSLIGDSFVAARQVPIADKFHVWLEALAARALPDLDVTTSAFGISGTGQINQLPLYDEFARRLRPRLLVLVFVSNDWQDNSDRMRWMTTARRNADGGMKLLPPDPDWRPPPRPAPGVLERYSYFANWLKPRLSDVLRFPHRRGGRVPPGVRPPRPDQVEFTAFGFDQFKERADRDGVALAILATYTMGTGGRPSFDRLNALAAARGIPVIDQFDHIRRRGAEIEDARWKHDRHWNADGHQWAAEALLDYLKRNPEVCARPWTGGR